jgi:RNA polymerase sigma factor (sigma-70 family)
MASGVVERDALLVALADLPVEQRAVLALRYFEDLTEVQTAEVLQISVGTVKSRTARAFEHLRVSLAEERKDA